MNNLNLSIKNSLVAHLLWVQRGAGLNSVYLADKE